MHTCPEPAVLCFSGTFFTHTALHSLRLYPFTDGWHPFVVAAELIYFLFLLYYMTVQVRQGAADLECGWGAGSQDGGW